MNAVCLPLDPLPLSVIISGHAKKMTYLPNRLLDTRDGYWLVD